MLYLGNQKVCFAIKKPSVEREVVNGVFAMPTNSIDIIMPDNATDIGDYGLYYAYYYATGVKSFNSNKVTAITGENALNQAFAYSSIETVSFPKLETVSGTGACASALYHCDNLTKLDLSSLKTISGSMAYIAAYCTSLTEVKFDSLETIAINSGLYYAFQYSTALEELSFPKLSLIDKTNVLQYACRGCTALKNVYFGGLKSTSFGTPTNQFSNMLNGVTGCIVHLPSSLNGHLGSRSFGGSSTSIVYDLPATE